MAKAPPVMQRPANAPTGTAKTTGAATATLTKEKGARKPAVKKAKYPVPEGGFKELPADFDLKKFAFPRRKDFADETLYLTLKADQMQTRVDNLRRMATSLKSLGSINDKAKAKRLLKVADQFAELKKSLAAQGVNVDELLAVKAASSEADDDGEEGGEEAAA